MNRLVFCSPVRLQLGCLNFGRPGECTAHESPVARPSYVVGGRRATLRATHRADLRLSSRPTLFRKPTPFRAGRGRGQRHDPPRWSRVLPGRESSPLTPNYTPGVTAGGPLVGDLAPFSGATKSQNLQPVDTCRPNKRPI